MLFTRVESLGGDPPPHLWARAALLGDSAGCGVRHLGGQKRLYELRSVFQDEGRLADALALDVSQLCQPSDGTIRSAVG